MLSTQDAIAAVLENVAVFPTETVAAEHAVGRVLRQPVSAERDQPPFDRVMMDGIAIAYADYADGQRAFPLQGLQAAGDPTQKLDSKQCLEIMTGASLPKGADCIVPVERISIDESVATIHSDFEVKAGRFIHSRGSDFEQGAELLSAGKRITAMDVAVVASCGETHLAVARDPNIRVISTGNELVAAGEPIDAHQIRSSNGPAIIALLQQHRYQRCSLDHIPDDLDALQQKLALHLDEADVLVLSGGVSMGKADFVPQVLEALGIVKVFHKVSQRPGKPLWFGKGPRGQLVFALPGNPVSALVCCRQYVIPALRKADGQRPAAPEFAALAANVSFAPALTCFQPVRLVSSAAGGLLALPVKTNTSGDFAALSETDGYVELAQETSQFDSGTPVVLNRWVFSQ